MPLKLQVGVSKKVGMPDYGSLGASCQIELQLDQTFTPSDADAIEEHVKQAYSACRQAVEEELTHNQKRDKESRDSCQTASQARSETSGNGRNGHHASQKQLDYIEQLAGQVHGLGARRLENLARKMYAKPLSDLSSLEASGLIDMLKEIKAGKIELSAALAGAAT
jgi:hypothetical protein